ncbi:hypothetical protein [Haladaptatus sp. NG-WS-4]
MCRKKLASRDVGRSVAGGTWLRAGGRVVDSTLVGGALAVRSGPLGGRSRKPHMFVGISGTDCLPTCRRPRHRGR